MDHSILELMGLPRIYLVDELTQASPTINKFELLNVDPISINIVARKQTWIYFLFWNKPPFIISYKY